MFYIYIYIYVFWYYSLLIKSEGPTHGTEFENTHVHNKQSLEGDDMNDFWCRLRHDNNEYKSYLVKEACMLTTSEKPVMSHIQFALMLDPKQAIERHSMIVAIRQVNSGITLFLQVLHFIRLVKTYNVWLDELHILRDHVVHPKRIMKRCDLIEKGDDNYEQYMENLNFHEIAAIRNSKYQNQTEFRICGRRREFRMGYISFKFDMFMANQMDLMSKFARRMTDISLGRQEMIELSQLILIYNPSQLRLKTFIHRVNMYNKALANSEFGHIKICGDTREKQTLLNKLICHPINGFSF